MMDCFCGMVDGRKIFFFFDVIISREYLSSALLKVTCSTEYIFLPPRISFIITIIIVNVIIIIVTVVLFLIINFPKVANSMACWGFVAYIFIFILPLFI